MKYIKKSILSVPVAFILNILLAYVVYFICRVIFILENWTIFSDSLLTNSLISLFKGSWLFDSSAILYTLSLYAVLMLFPIHYKERHLWQQIAKWIFVAVNSIVVCLNLADAVYFKSTNRRVTSTCFKEFENETNIGNILLGEIANHWYLFLFAAAIIYLLIKLYVMPGKKSSNQITKYPHWRYYLLHSIIFLLYIPISICGMRGGATEAVRPITISNANQYVNKPIEAAMVLNTPFSLIRTFNKKGFTEQIYFSQNELSSIYCPIHIPMTNDSVAAGKNKNFVILIIESFGREYIGALNEHLENGHYKGYTPFTDSLIQHSLTFDYSFCNGRRSIDGMPAVLSAIPMFIEPFFTSPHSLNDISGIAGELGKNGYYSAFFHGAENGSMGFQAFARTTGFKNYFGRTEYNQDKRFEGDKDFDGTWAIWDEPFLQFFALKMNEFKQPFITSIFTASSHHPYAIPDKYKKIYPEEGIEIHKCIRYVDNALREFFNTAKQQPWYNNTIFVITSDHTNLTDHKEYQTDMGYCCSPIIFFDPSGSIKPARRHAIAQHIDIMPTLLNYAGYDRPYVAFGKDLLNTSDEKTWAVNYINDVYQYVEGDYVIFFANGQVLGVYNYKTDWLLKNNLLGKTGTIEQNLLKKLKAIIQSYMYCMVNNKLIL